MTFVVGSLAKRISNAPWNLYEPALQDVMKMSCITNKWYKYGYSCRCPAGKPYLNRVFAVYILRNMMDC